MDDRTPPPARSAVNPAWWARSAAAVAEELGSGPEGLTSDEALRRLKAWGANVVRPPPIVDPWRLLVRQLANPLVAILVVAAVISTVLGELVDAGVIVLIVAGSAALTFWRELGAARAVDRLRQRLVLRVEALRDGGAREVAAAEIVPGDVVLLAAGSLVPADGVLLDATDLFVNESTLTGETYPAAKRPGPSATDAPLAARDGALFQGTSVRSGFARLLVVTTGGATIYGGIAGELQHPAQETELERGLRRFGYLLTRIMLVLVLVVFAANILDRKPAIDSLLFALALAVGISPELLPAIIAVNLARGAQRMAARGVIVRRLDAIESFGSMEVLCTDKTGTLTRGVMAVTGAVDGDGRPSPEVLRVACLNALLESGLANPLDDALRAEAAVAGVTAEQVVKVGEVPYDFVRKRLAVAIEERGRRYLLVKGAFDPVAACCSRIATATGETALAAEDRDALERRFAAWSDEGLRVLGVARRPLAAGEPVCRDAERDLTFLGFLLFADPPKPGVAEHIATLRALGVELKILTGDNRRVAAHLARTVGLADSPLLTGADVDRLRGAALWHRARHTAVFAELEPQHKDRLLRALQRGNRAVGFLGDGVNDAPALHVAEVGISVDSAVDVAKEAADFVLLEPDLGVLAAGIREGRHTFANTMKYVHATASANFGNMVSMAVASAGLPFLPLLAKQILLNNFLSDLPAVALAGDAVDAEELARPRRWDLAAVRDFMIVFGLVSSLFDLLLFALLLWVVAAPAALFRSAWFVASLLTEVAVMFVVRTRLPVLRSRPSRWLVWTSVAVAAIGLASPHLPYVATLFGFVPLPPSLLALVLGLTIAYLLASEAVKHRFYRHRAAD